MGHEPHAPDVRAVAVLGAGSWGTALALLLARRPARVRLWEFDPQRAARLDRERRSLPFLPEHEIPSSVAISADLDAVLDGADVAVVVVPSHVLRATGRRIAASGRDLPSLWVSAVKGIEEDSGLTPSQVLQASAGVSADRIVVLAGPSLALEVAAGKPAAVLAACRVAEPARTVQALFAGDRFRVYSSDDPLGVEVGVALKNVVAIAAGIAGGLDLGYNARGALVTRGLAEIARLGVRMGGRFETFLGLAGIGDLVTTATSELSRNYRVGLGLARGLTVAQILAELGMVAEGVRTARSALQLARRHGIEMPITEQVDAVLHAGKDPRAAVEELMRRPLRPEFEGREP